MKLLAKQIGKKKSITSFLKAIIFLLIYSRWFINFVSLIINWGMGKHFKRETIETKEKKNDIFIHFALLSGSLKRRSRTRQESLKKISNIVWECIEVCLMKYQSIFELVINYSIEWNILFKSSTSWRENYLTFIHFQYLFDPFLTLAPPWLHNWWRSRTQVIRLCTQHFFNIW